LLLAVFLTFSFVSCKAQTLSRASSTLSLPESASAAPQNSYAAVVSRVMPAVVTVRSDRRVRAAQQFPFFDDPFFRDFFGDRFRNAPKESPEILQRGVGSGVIVSSDGYILTNHHVIDGGEGIKVDLSDGRTLDARVIGSDKPSDLAVLKINAANLPVLPLGDSDRVKVGDVVLAVGNPLGVGQTATMGLISAQGRQTGISNGSFEDFLQTDAAINQGNSGGALVNATGQVVGISEAYIPPSQGAVSIGFATPAATVVNTVEQLLRSGRAQHAFVGIQPGELTPEIAQQLGVSQSQGVVVLDVVTGGPADKAGMRPGDVITALDGKPVATVEDFLAALRPHRPGDTVTVTFLRGDAEQEAQVTLTDRPPSSG